MKTPKGKCSCGQDGVVLLWCPTWTTSFTGPKWLCPKCYEVFDPSQNKNAVGGSWHIGPDACKAFSVCLIIPRGDERFLNAVGMVLGDQIPGFLSKTVRVVDGRAWLITWSHATDLGRYEEAKEIFPALFCDKLSQETAL